MERENYSPLGLHKICSTYRVMMKLGTGFPWNYNTSYSSHYSSMVLLYLKKFQKPEHVTHTSRGVLLSHAFFH